MIMKIAHLDQFDWRQNQSCAKTSRCACQSHRRQGKLFFHFSFEFEFVSINVNEINIEPSERKKI